MTKIKTTLKAVQSLGVFGFILVCAVIIIGVSIYNIFLIDEGIVDIHEHSQRRTLYELIEFNLLQEELAERAYVLHADDEALARFEQASLTLDTLIAELRELTESESHLELDLIEHDREAIEADFEEVAALVDEGEVDIQLLDEVFRAEEGIDQQLDDMVFEADIALEEEVEAVSNQNQSAVLAGLVGLIIFPLLAIWAFLVSSKLTQPILSLTNAVVAAKGNRYRVELLEEALDRHDGLGKLAQAIDTMAESLSEQEAALQREVDTLNQQLHESRRRKMVLTGLARPREE